MSEGNGDSNGQERRGCRGCYVNDAASISSSWDPFIHRVFFAYVFGRCLLGSVRAVDAVFILDWIH